MNLPPGIIKTPEGFHVLAEDSHASRWIEEHKRLDIAVSDIALFSHLIAPGSVVIDAGASLGDHTITYAQLVGPTGKVFAIEPGPLTFKAMELNMAPFPQVMPLNVALGAQEGEASFITAPNIGASCIGEGGDTVPLTTIDALKLERLDLIHLDAEGFEPFILRGARTTLTKFKPHMVIEVNKGALARYGGSDVLLYVLLDELGYEWKELASWFNRDMEQRDILCSPK